MLPQDYSRDDALGVRLDTLVDGRIEAENHLHQLREVYVTLDSLADAPVVYTDDELTEIRMVQKTIEAMIDSLEANVEHINDEIATVRDEL